MNLGPVVVTQTLATTRAHAWQLLVDAKWRSRWWPDMSIDAVVGGAVTEQWSEREGDEILRRDASGAVDMVEPEHSLGFRWQEQGDPFATTVVIRFSDAENRSGHTHVTVVESGFAALPDPIELVEHSQLSWSVLLQELAILARQENSRTALEEDSSSESQVLVYNEALTVGEEVEGELIDDVDSEPLDIAVVVENEQLAEIESALEGAEIDSIEIVIDTDGEK